MISNLKGLSDDPIDPIPPLGLGGQQLDGLSLKASSSSAPPMKAKVNVVAPEGNAMSPLASMGAGMAVNKALSGTPMAGLGGSLVSLAQGNERGALTGLATWGIGKGLAEAGLQEAVPYVGSALQLAQGNVGGAVGSAAGTYIGTAIGGPVGGVIGSMLGSMIGGGCFITTAVMEATGSDDDDSIELEAMRALRDQYILGELGDQDIINQYYSIAPRVVLALSRRPDAQEIYLFLYEQFIAPATQMVLEGDWEEAYSTYLSMIEFVTPLAQEVDPSETALQEMEGLKRHAQLNQGVLEMMQGVNHE